MTRKQFDEQLDKLKELLTDMGELNCEAIDDAVTALETQDTKLAKETKAVETAVDEKESEIERLCLKIILKQQPVASDLLFVTGAMKMITDMERIADQAVDISELVVKMSALPYADGVAEISDMGDRVRDMVRLAVESFVERDAEKAKEACRADDAVDDLFDTVKKRLTGIVHREIEQEDNGEQALEIADSLIRSSAIDIIVIDSVAALTPKAEIEGEMGDSKMGLQARLMSQALRKLTSSISKTKTVCIFINQLRDKIGVVYGNPETTTGGNALKFYASVRIDIRRMSVIKDGEDQLGTRTKVKVVKNKVAPPFKRAEFDIMFGEGISKIGEIVDLGVDYGVVKKAGSWFSYGDRKIGQGRDAVKELLKNDEELRNEIEAKVREAMKTTKKE